MTMKIFKSYFYWADLATEGRVKVFHVYKSQQQSGFLLKKKQDKLDQPQILVFHGSVDHFSTSSLRNLER